MARLRGVGTPLMSEISYMSLADLLSLYDAQVVNGRHYELQTRWLADLLPEIISRDRRGRRCAKLTAFLSRDPSSPRSGYPYRS
jgi:hypothetical protein